MPSAKTPSPGRGRSAGPPPPTRHVEHRQRSLALYARRAPLYDVELAAFESLRREAVAALQLQPGQQVLDVGCGTGLSLPLLHEVVGRHGRIVAVEQSPPMLAQARQRCKGWPGVEFIESAAEEAPLPGDMDAALLFFTHDLMQHPEALDRLLAALKPGAHVVAVGLVWAPPWLPLSNLFVLAGALNSITCPAHLDQPWHALAPRLQELSVQTRWMESIYLLKGRA